MLRSKFADLCYLKVLIEIYKLLIKPAEVTIYIILIGLIVSLIIYLPHVILNKKMTYHYLQVTECGFMDRNYFNIEQSDIDAFYQNFSLKHPKTAKGKYKRLSDFLKGK